MSNLRFIMRDGKKILQYQIDVSSSSTGYPKTFIWEDVPFIEEESKKPREFWVHDFKEGRIIDWGHNQPQEGWYKVREVIE